MEDNDPKSSVTVLSNKQSKSSESEGQALEMGNKNEIPMPLKNDIEREVTFTVTIAIAVPTEADEQKDLQEIINKRVVESPRAKNYYHLEYQLLPEEDALMKTDVVTYGLACKIFMEKYETKVVKTWQDENTIWFAWAHSYNLIVTNEMLVKLLNRTVELRLWDTKDKCSARARFDRPKAFRLPQPKPGEKPEDIGGVRTMVIKEMKHYMRQQPKKGSLTQSLPSLAPSTDTEDRKDCEDPGYCALTTKNTRSSHIFSSAPNAMGSVAVSLQSEKNGKSLEFLSQLLRADGLEGQKEEKKRLLSQALTQATSELNKKTKVISKDDLTRPVDEQARTIAESVRKNGLCMIPLRLALLFGDKKVVISRLEQTVPGLEDMFFSVSVNRPLLSPSQKASLNPMMIQIQNATCLPYAELRLKCQPVYCKYKFFREPEYTTTRKEHNENIHWNDTSVVLLGTMDPAQLREYLNGPPMDIEVHDRDRLPESWAPRPTLFGDDPEDDKIANVGTVESRRTLYDPFQKRDKPWDPFGVARVDWSELLLGHRQLELKMPIQNCHVPDILGPSQNPNAPVLGVSGAVDGPTLPPVSAGHYVESEAMLKIKITLAYPLTTPEQLAEKEYIPTSIESPFNRMVFIFKHHDMEMLRKVETLVMSFNAKALALDTLPQHVIDVALSTYKLSIVQQCSLDLDIVTGFHVLDGEWHIIVLEGLRDSAILTLWETLPMQENSGTRVLYNSDLSFSKRLYGPLDVDLCQIKLHEPLSVIVQQPLLYIRDMVFRPCYNALTKLDQMTKMATMRGIVRNDLFPTVEMVVCMSREFGVPFTHKDLFDLQPVDKFTFQSAPNTRSASKELSHQPTTLDNLNYKYEEYLRREKKHQNFLFANIKNVSLKSKNRDKKKERHIALRNDPVYNYSSQNLNSSELAKEKLRQYLKANDPEGLYTFNPEYMSSMFSLVNMEQERKDEAAASCALWQTKEGWTFPGKNNLPESTTLHSARVEELKEKWVENLLHPLASKSVLDRGHYPWDKRQDDMDLYSGPPLYFGKNEPQSIHYSGVKLAAEKQAAKQKQLEDWKSQVVVDDVRQYFHRLLPATEMKMKGFYSSNQIDRMEGMLKDPIKKRGLLASGPNVNDIPVLAVVNDPCLDTLARLQGVPVYPAPPETAYEKSSGFKPGELPKPWAGSNNQIPCYDYEHAKFQELKGHDFNVYHKSRNKLSLRPIVSLHPEERDNHLFRVPLSAVPYSQPLPDVGQQQHTFQPILKRCNSHQMAVECEDADLEPPRQR